MGVSPSPLGVLFHRFRFWLVYSQEQSLLLLVLYYLSYYFALLHKSCRRVSLPLIARGVSMRNDAE